MTNIASMVGVTDIPDWCVYEATGEYDFSSYEVPGPDVLKVMWDKSPMQYVEKGRQAERPHLEVTVTGRKF